MVIKKKNTIQLFIFKKSSTHQWNGGSPIFKRIKIIIKTDFLKIIQDKIKPIEQILWIIKYFIILSEKNKKN